MQVVVLIDSIEYLIELYFQEIPRNINQIMLTPTGSSHFPSPSFELEYKDNMIIIVNPMGYNLNHSPMWISQGSLNLDCIFHDLCKFIERILPKFGHDKACNPKYHIKNFYLALHLMNVLHEDMVCKIFPCTLKNKASTRYYKFLTWPIGSWEAIEKAFINLVKIKPLLPSSRNLKPCKWRKMRRQKTLIKVLLLSLTYSNKTYNPLIAWLYNTIHLLTHIHSHVCYEGW